jgi:hypothetical protein
MSVGDDYVIPYFWKKKETEVNEDSRRALLQQEKDKTNKFLKDATGS